MNLTQFESALAAVADDTLTSVAPSGGFATYLQKNPSVAALFSIAVITAHNFLSKIETQNTIPVPGPASATVGVAPAPKAPS